MGPVRWTVIGSKFELTHFNNPAATLLFSSTYLRCCNNLSCATFREIDFSKHRVCTIDEENLLKQGM